ncbi:MAG: ABC transporter permease [Caldisericaceae bacterium]
MSQISFKLEKRSTPPVWFQILTPFLAIVISLLISSIFLLILKQNPLSAFYYMFTGAVGSKFAFFEMLVKASPLILTGIAVAFAFTAKYWNIGAEGQLYAGALAATWVGLMDLKISPFIYIPLIICVGFAAGALWSLIAGYLKARWKVDDVVTTLLLNYVMIYIVSALLNGPWRDPVTMYPSSPLISPNAYFPKLIPQSRIHLGILISLLAVIFMWFIIKKTKLGFEIRSTGASPRAANFLGINTLKSIIIVSIISGGIAGLAGVGEVAGVQYHLIQTISPGYGYSGIVIAMLGRLNPFGVLLAAIYFAIDITGANVMSYTLHIPIYISDVIQGVTLIVMLTMLLFFEYRVRIGRAK